MRYIVFIALVFITGCAQHNEVDIIARQVAESKAAFDKAIPYTWSPENYSVRVISDYKSKGATGVVAMDKSNTIATFEICSEKTKKCIGNAAKAAVLNCENTVRLGLRFNILKDIVDKCRVVIINDKFINERTIKINGVEYKNGSNI